MKLPIPFDNPTTYPGHSGVDFGQPRGTVFRASGPGVVTTLGQNARGGFYIWVRYDNGFEVGYHHMDSHEGCPAKGTRVAEGTPLGLVGNSGNSTGPHLHSEVAGRATTDGYWSVFDRNRVVGKENDLGTLDNTEANYQVFARWLQRALKYDVRVNGFGPDWRLGVTLWERIGQVEAAARTGADIDKEDIDAIVNALAEAIPADIANDVVTKLAERLSK